MNKQLSVGVVGLSMGRQHLEGALSYGARIGGICDTNPQRLEKVGLDHGIDPGLWHTDYKALADDPTIDAVIIATPDQLHRQMVLEFLEAGKHVLCEKPLALTREDLNAIVSAAEASDRKCMVGQICRFTPAFEQAKAIVDAGTIGELYYVESEYAHDYARMFSKGHHWRMDPQRHGVVGGGCHAVDLLRWFAGDPVEVFAYGTHKLLPQVSYDDATISVMKFPNDVMGKIFVSTGCKRNYTMRTLLYGTKGTIICDNTSTTMQLFTMDEDGRAETPQILPVNPINHNTEREFQVFADAIARDLPLEMTAREGAKTVVASLAMVESSEKGGVVVVPDYDFN